MMAAARQAKPSKVPVSERAVVQRINRKLRQEHEQLHATRPGTQAELTLGRYYVRNVTGNYIVSMHVDVEKLGREVEAIAEWEEMVEDE